MSEDDEIVQAFLVESAEGLDQLDQDLVELEQAPDAREVLSRIFRTIHTIKGASGFFAFGRLEHVTHHGENVLGRLRDGEIALTPPMADALLRMVDTTRALLAVIAATGTDADDTVDVDAAVDLLAASVDAANAEPAEQLGVVAPEPVPEVPEVPDVPEVLEVPEVPEVPEEPEEPEAAAPRPEATIPTPVPASAAPANPAPANPASASPASASPAPAETVRVDVDLLDTLVRLVGELVLTRNQILQQAGAQTDQELLRASQRLNMVASELQENVMRTRMQPIGQAWTKYPRVVRDLAAQLGKNVRLDMSGQETELDRSLLEAVKDPLTHLVRNAMDHGLESPAERIAAGKPEQGVLALRAYHESGQVVVEMTDDGRGLDAARIGATAVARGVVTHDQLSRMTEREVNELIFRPGFSTAATVSNVSGRGVGMDVVRTNIEHIGGVVDLVSRHGRGTTVRVRIPLTLAIIPALIVGEGGERFAIPQANLVELVRLDAAEISTSVETLAGSRILRLRGQLLPLVTLSAELGLPPGSDEAMTVVVVQADETRFGLAVEAVHDTQEIVVKPLGRQLKSIAMYAGATIMGDGRASLILDIGGVAHRAGVGEGAQVRIAGENADTAADTTSLLVVDLGADRRAALPLAEISRLEEFDVDQFENSGGIEAMQYRDGILPLVRLAETIGLVDAEHTERTVSVIVHEQGDARVGIVAHRVVDVVDATVVPTGVGARRGVLGSAIVLDRITDLIDLPAVVASVGSNR